MATRVWTVLQIMQWTAEYFGRKGVDSPRLTAEILLGHALKCTRIKLYTDFERPLQEPELAAYRGLIERRIAGEPTFYLVGEREFYGRRFKVDARVLIPRPETERLVELVLERLAGLASVQVLDLCTGSGAVALSLAAELPQASVVATDLSPGALSVARENAETLGLAPRVTLLEGDLFGPVPADSRFDAVVANPPYIAAAAWASLPAEVRAEPRLALLGGADGLDLLRRLSADARRWLKPDGLLALEIGDDQAAAMTRILEEGGYANVSVARDWAGKDRVALATNSSSTPSAK
jgi:release factor glutamine methyltransferase